MCEIVIEEVIGVSDNSNTVVAIRVKGTAIGCKTINISVECEDYITTKTIDVDTLDHGTSWEVDFSDEEEINCKCNTNIIVIAKCDEDSNCNDQWEGLLPCEEEPTIECPEVNWSGFTINGCLIYIEATVRHSGEFSAELRNSSDDILASVSGSGSGETILPYEGYHQSETFHVIVTTPDQCTGLTLHISATCDVCPNISFDYELSECNEDTCNLSHV